MTEQRQNHDNQYYEKQQQKENHYYYNNNYNIRDSEERILKECDCELLKEAYNDNIGRMTGAVANMLEKAFERGLEVDELVMAIEETGFAPNPSAYYLKAILENWVTNGVTISRIKHQIKVNKGHKWWRD